MKRLPLAEPEDVSEAAAAAAAVVAEDGVVLLPTETYYGLGANPSSATAVDRIINMKGRPPQMALPVLVADWQQLESLVVVPEAHRVRLSRSWPGALTVILPARAPLAAAGGQTLAVRIPGHGLLRSLLYRLGPLTGTSANLHGVEACVRVHDALASLRSAPDLVLDGGETAGGAASTLVDLCGSQAKILRQGPVEWQDFYARLRLS